MKTSTNLRMKLPEGKDPVDISDITDNFETLDSYLQNMQTSTSDGSKNTVTFSTASDRNNIASTEALATIMGKIAKWFGDLKAAAFKEVANNDTTTNDGYVADARIVKTHGDEIDAVKSDVSTLSSKVASFQTGVDALYNKCVSLGVTPSGKTLDAVTNALQNVYNTGYSKGNSAGYNAGVAAADARVDSSTANYKGGYTAGYNAGVAAADARVDSSTANYKGGYTAGYNAGVAAADARVSTSSASYTSGYNSGYSAGKSAASVKLKYVSNWTANSMSFAEMKLMPSLTKQSDGTWLLDASTCVIKTSSDADWANRDLGRTFSTTTLS